MFNGKSERGLAHKIDKKTMENTLANMAQPTAIRDIVSTTTGKVRGSQYLFACAETPLELKSRLKDAGLKGNKLSSAIREIRKGSMSLAWAETQVFMEGMRHKGFIPVQAQELKNTGCLRFEKLKDEPVKKTTSSEEVLNTAAKNLADKIGCSLEQALEYLK